MLVRDGSLLPHIKLAQCTAEMDWSRITLKAYCADRTEAEGWICLPTDNRLQSIKADYAKGKPQLTTDVQGTKITIN